MYDADTHDTDGRPGGGGGTIVVAADAGVAGQPIDGEVTVGLAFGATCLFATFLVSVIALIGKAS